jgi:hypothetical protein
MLNVRNRMFLIVAHLLCLCLLLLSCATEEAALQPSTPLEGLDLELVGGRLEIQNPMPRNREEVEVMVIVRNRGNQDAKRVPVFFYDNLRVFSTEEIDLEPGGQWRLSARWRATMGNHIISVVLDPAHHFKEMRRGKSEASTTVLVK